MNIEIIRNKIKSNFLGYFLLWLLSIIYWIIFNLKKMLYQLNILKRYKSKTQIICIGNVSSGGTGKTTFTASYAVKLKQSGKNIAVILRGYKSKFSRNEITDIDYDEFEKFINNPDVSDETKLLAFLLKEHRIPVVASKNRIKSIEYTESKYKPEIILMDDGYQNFKIEKHYNILIINMTQLNDKLLPLGNLRETYSSGIKRANTVILNRTELYTEKDINERFEKLKKYNPIATFLKSKYIPKNFFDLCSYENVDFNIFKQNNAEIAVFSGIGDNKGFRDMLSKHGFKIVKSWEYPDHHEYSLEDLYSINEIRGNLPVITTFKDAMKFISFVRMIFKEKIYTVNIEMLIEGNDTEKIINI